eukprot:COSAG02_NODE_8014_length_2745_cov_7.637482_3_plen_156_part_00
MPGVLLDASPPRPWLARPYFSSLAHLSPVAWFSGGSHRRCAFARTHRTSKAAHSQSVSQSVTHSSLTDLTDSLTHPLTHSLTQRAWVDTVQHNDLPLYPWHNAVRDGFQPIDLNLGDEVCAHAQVEQSAVASECCRQRVSTHIRDAILINAKRSQ